MHPKANDRLWDIERNFNLLVESNWANRLESIEFLKNLKTPDDVAHLHSLSKNFKGKEFVIEISQVYEYLIRDSRDPKVWEMSFYALGDLFLRLSKDNGPIVEETLENLIQEKIMGRKTSLEPTYQRADLIYALSKAWSRANDELRFYFVKKIVKFKLRELYSLVNQSLDFGDKKTSINILRSMVQQKEKRVAPVISKWLKSKDPDKVLEAISALSTMGDIFDILKLYKVLKREKGLIRLRACIALLNILPFGGSKILKDYWEIEEDLEMRKKFLNLITTTRELYILNFLREKLLFSTEATLEMSFVHALSSYSHPKKVEVLTQGFHSLSEDKKISILMALKGRPYHTLETFYLEAISTSKNPVINILILESLASFKSFTVASFIYRYLKEHDDMTLSYAFTSLVKCSPELAGDYILNDFLEGKAINISLSHALLKYLPTLSPYILINDDFRNLLQSRYLNGKLTEKTYILRALPFLLDPSLLEMVVDDFKDYSNASLTTLKGVSLIKSCFHNSELLEIVIPLFDEPLFVHCFKEEKIKAPFVEALGILSLEHDILQTYFFSQMMRPILQCFLDNIGNFEVPAVVILYFRLLQDHPHLVTEERIAIAEKAYYRKGLGGLDEAFLEFSLLSGSIERLSSFLENSTEVGPEFYQSKALRFCIGGAGE